MTKLLVFILTTISITVAAQPENCGCFNGIGSSESTKPSLTTKFSNGVALSVCGYEREKLSENEVLISEFNVFNCNTGERLVEYTAVQNCIVRKTKLGLEIIELTFLPAGENWKWEQVKIGEQQIVFEENQLVVLDQKPAFEEAKIDQIEIDSFFEQMRNTKGTGKLEDPEEILGRLEFLALNDFKEAVDILYDFENYFKYQTDGAIAEQLKDAVETVKWVKD